MDNKIVEVVAQELDEHFGGATKPAARAALTALRAAGYRIAGPDEVVVSRDFMDELGECLALADSDGERAQAFQNVPEDAAVRDLCERHGYGAVMDSAARQWFLKDSVGAQTTWMAAGSVRKLKAAYRAMIGASHDQT